MSIDEINFKRCKGNFDKKNPLNIFFETSLQELHEHWINENKDVGNWFDFDLTDYTFGSLGHVKRLLEDIEEGFIFREK